MREIDRDLLVAVLCDDKEGASHDIAKGANPNECIRGTGNTRLHLTKCSEMAQILINGNADVDAQNNRGDTALHQALDDENIPLVETLLQAGANPFILNDREQTAIVRINSLNIPKLSEMAENNMQRALQKIDSKVTCAMHEGKIDSLERGR